MNRLPLSVFIIAVNEADRIAASIKSAWLVADEVIVIDSGSTDNTVEVAKANGAQVYYREWTGYGEQKRFGESQCHHSWVLNLDADECLTEALAAEIRALFAKGPPSHSGYRMRIYEIFPGEKRIPLRCRYINAVRLYDMTAARYAESTVHDTVQVHTGEVAQLEGAVLHYSSRSIAHSIEKLNRYSSMQVEDLSIRDVELKPTRLYTEFIVNFFKAYIGRLYILRGHQGFTYAILYAFSRFARIAKYQEARAKK